MGVILCKNIQKTSICNWNVFCLKYDETASSGQHVLKGKLVEMTVSYHGHSSPIYRSSERRSRSTEANQLAAEFDERTIRGFQQLLWYLLWTAPVKARAVTDTLHMHGEKRTIVPTSSLWVAGTAFTHEIRHVSIGQHRRRQSMLQQTSKPVG